MAKNLKKLLPALHIYIATLGRAEPTRQTTLLRIPEAWRKHTTLVVAKEEKDAYSNLVTRHTPGVNVVVSWDQGKRGLNVVRDWMVGYAEKSGHRYVVFLDDDVYLGKRREDGRITTCTEAEWGEAFVWLQEQFAAGFAHCGWGARFLAFSEKVKTEMRSARAMYCLAYDLAALRETKSSFTKGFPDKSSMSDFHMTLQLLEAGKDNVISLVWRTSPSGSNSKGGCSLYRTGEVQSASAAILAKLHPKTVTIRQKEAWPGMGVQFMNDVTVGWKKALGAGVKP